MDQQQLAEKVEFTDHVERRGAQRNLSESEIRYVVRYGKCFRRQGRSIYYLRRRDLPQDDRAVQKWRRLVGVVVVVDPAGEVVITAWRDWGNSLQRIKRLPRYRDRRLEFRMLF